MSSGSISKGVYLPVVQMRSPGCQWQDNEKASSMDWSLRSVSWSLQPKSSQDDWRDWRANTSQEGKVGTLIFFPGAGTAKELLYRHGPENTGLKPSLFHLRWRKMKSFENAMPVASRTSQVPAISKVGSWSNFVSKDAMRFDEATLWIHFAVVM